MIRTHGRIVLAVLVLVSGLLTGNAADAQSDPEAISVGTVVGKVGGAVAVRDGGIVALVVGSEIHARDRIRTSINAKVEIELVNGGRLIVGPDCGLEVERFAEEMSPGVVRGAVQLFDGIIRLVLRALPSGSEFNVTTEAAVATVRGTEFTIEVAETKEGAKTSVFVATGMVAVSGFRGNDAELGAGDGIDVTAGSPLGEVKEWGAARVRRVINATTLP